MGPSIEPWGTPDPMPVHSDDVPSITTLCFLSARKLDKMFIASSSIPILFNLNIRPSCHTLSNALLISRKTARISWDFPKAL